MSHVRGQENNKEINKVVRRYFRITVKKRIRRVLKKITCLCLNLVLSSSKIINLNKFINQ